MESLSVFALVQPITNVLNGVATATLIGVGGVWVIQGKIKLGVIVAFLGYLRNLFQPIRDLVEKYNTFLSAMVSAERVVSLLEEPIEEEIGTKVLTPGNGGQPDLDPTRADLVFDHVSFRYPTRDGLALNSVNFQLKAGDQLAVVGATGSGKSTLIRLLLRF